MTGGLLSVAEDDEAKVASPATASTDEERRSKVLVLGLGNLLLSDDAVGLRLLEGLGCPPSADCIDGGTLGLALLPFLAGRSALIILDAVALGAPPGTVHVLSEADLPAQHAATAHGTNALDVLAMAALLGELPPSVTIVGIEPAKLATGIGLSPRVESAIPKAISLAREILKLECDGVPVDSREKPI